MAQELVRCPACNRELTRGGLRLHFRQALSGWDPSWDIRKLHTRWARSRGIEVTDEGVAFNFDKLNDALDEYLSGQ